MLDWSPPVGLVTLSAPVACLGAESRDSSKCTIWAMIALRRGRWKRGSGVGGGCDWVRGSTVPVMVGLGSAETMGERQGLCEQQKGKTARDMGGGVW